MKRIIISFIAALSLLSPLSAFEWSGLLDNNTKLTVKNNPQDPSSNPLSLSQSNGIYLSASSNLTKSGNIYITGEGMYKYTYNSLYKGTPYALSQVADLDLLKITGNLKQGKANINFSAGRFIITDLSSAIFTQTCDGAFLEYAAPQFGLSVYAGFTGLLNSNSVYILNSEGKAHAPANDIYALSAKYIPVCLTFAFPSLFLNQNVSLQANAFIDCSEKKYNRMYAVLNVTGPLASKVFYNFVTDFGTENFSNISNFTKLSVSAFPVSSLYFTGACEYASGKNGFLSDFRGFSYRAAYSASKDFQTTGEIIPSVAVNYSVTRNLLIGADVKSVFSCPDSNISATGLSAGLNCVYNIFSDLNITANISGFKGYTDSNLDNFTASVKVAVSF